MKAVHLAPVDRIIPRLLFAWSLRPLCWRSATGKNDFCGCERCFSPGSAEIIASHYGGLVPRVHGKTAGYFAGCCGARRK